MWLRHRSSIGTGMVCSRNEKAKPPPGVLTARELINELSRYPLYWSAFYRLSTLHDRHVYLGLEMLIGSWTMIINSLQHTLSSTPFIRCGILPLGYYPILAALWNSAVGVNGCTKMVKEKCRLVMPTLPSPLLDTHWV